MPGFRNTFTPTTRGYPVLSRSEWGCFVVLLTPFRPTPHVCRGHHLLSFTPSHNVWRQHVAREVKAALDQILRALEGAVLMLDADDAIISGGVERR